jgi:uncharacterized protein (TIGR03545 family)
MMRFTYLIPRMVIIGLIALAIWVGIDPLVRYVVVSRIENATGAKVEIGHLRTSISNQKIFLKDVEIADPRSPMKNLVQAEMAYVELNPQSLLGRQFVIEHGQTSQVVFGAPRTDSGALEGFPHVGAAEEFTWQPKQFEPIEKIGLNWIDQLQPYDTDSLSIENLELVQATVQQDQFWTDALATQQQNFLALQEKIAKLKKIARENENPLRPRFVSTDAEIQALASQTKAIEARLFELQKIAISNRDSLELFHHRDFEKLRQSVQTTSFDSDSISRLLLTRLQEQRVAEVINWFQWFRSAIPDPATDFQPKHKRGVDIQLSGVKPGPKFLIKSIDLEGEGRFANRHINFAGSAYDLTSEPALHDRPASFELRAQGDQHLIVTCMLDRRGDEPIDRLKLLCPDTELPEQVLGEENSILVTMGPASRMQAEIQIQALGDQLTGELVFRHSNVVLHVDKLHEMIGGSNTALQMNQGLAKVNRFESKITISGTPDDYHYQFQSDLGSRFSIAVNTLLTDKNEQQITKRKQDLDQLLMRQVAKLDNEILPQLQKLARLLNAETIEIASLRDAIPTNQNGLPRIR